MWSPVCLTSSYDSHISALCGELAGRWHRGHVLGFSRQLQLRDLRLAIRKCFDLEPYKTWTVVAATAINAGALEVSFVLCC